jgi:hypothetical protein
MEPDGQGGADLNQDQGTDQEGEGCRAHSDGSLKQGPVGTNAPHGAAGMERILGDRKAITL